MPKQTNFLQPAKDEDILYYALSAKRVKLLVKHDAKCEMKILNVNMLGLRLCLFRFYNACEEIYEPSCFYLFNH
jgi:hypothetical protein